MKYLIASDLHGSAYWCEKLMQAFARERADKLILLGDLLYHGPRNPLPEGHDAKRTAQLLNSVKDKILCVRGNCDAEVDQVLLEFPIFAENLLLEQNGKTVFCTHGHHYSPQNPPYLNRGDVLLTGHTHVVAKERTETFTYLNPGSVALPKGNGQRGYLTLEKGKFVFCRLDGETTDEYDMASFEVK